MDGHCLMGDLRVRVVKCGYETFNFRCENRVGELPRQI